MSSKYFERLKTTLDGVVAKLIAKGIEPRHLAFGGEGAKPARKPRVPTDARSEFLANRAMGDWAERMLSKALLASLPEWKVVQYGNTDRIAAGHPEFKARYLAGLEETRLFGKRPDMSRWSATNESICAPRSTIGNDSSSTSRFTSRTDSACFRVGISGQGIASTSFGSSLLRPSP
ncbi:MAG: AccI family restriction endonuclease [Verrucomicrobia bacterium]|nr:AccI family restriction endonuclease [Verrucomicrobiota bacterium]